MKPTERLLSSADAARMLRRTTRHVTAYLAPRAGVVKHPAGVWLFTAADVAAMRNLLKKS